LKAVNPIADLHFTSTNKEKLETIYLMGESTQTPLGGVSNEISLKVSN
jgi:hypothetical protein